MKKKFKVIKLSGAITQEISRKNKLAAHLLIHAKERMDELISLIDIEYSICGFDSCGYYHNETKNETYSIIIKAPQGNITITTLADCNTFIIKDEYRYQCADFHHKN